MKIKSFIPPEVTITVIIGLIVLLISDFLLKLYFS
ncbi:hypothetical protein bsdtw1_03052 [Clostridium fungisolvens]|uniref:Uncharacterized protein n=1 Tax=Clostridium fungisolvens TaxID=1604897 RepID=A0A6V8SJ11_9CLOT|nr:hypothetical protein bsdtw1_03052 [Clostridium fungisolvens]